MAKPAAAPPPWGTAGNYPPSNYQDPLPWGDPNPLGGGATPWSGGPRLDAVGLAAFAANGLEPEAPTPAESFNEWLRQAQESLQWVQDGSLADDADAHIVETDGAGAINVQSGVFTLGAKGKGVGAALILIDGADVPALKTLEIADTADISMVGTARVNSVATTVVESGLFEFVSGAAAPGSRQMSMGTTGIVAINDGTTSHIAHMSPNGWVYATGEQVAETGLAVIQQVAETSVAIKALGLGNVRVIVEGECQHSSLPNNWTVAVQHDQGGWTNIGATKTFTGLVDTSDANNWQYFRHERTFNAGTSTATKYRAVVDPAGSTGKVREVYLRVVNERA